MKHLLKGLTTIVVATVMTSTFCLAQNSSNDLQRELERLHNQWFNAFDKGDGATMDKMEMPNLILVNADGKGGIWKKDGPRTREAKTNWPLKYLKQCASAAIRQFSHSYRRSNDQRRAGRSSATVVWIRRNNQWLVASAQWSACDDCH